MLKEKYNTKSSTRNRSTEEGLRAKHQLLSFKQERTDLEIVTVEEIDQHGKMLHKLKQRKAEVISKTQAKDIESDHNSKHKQVEIDCSYPKLETFEMKP